MNDLLKEKYVLLFICLLMCFFSGKAFGANSRSAACKNFNGTIISIWEEDDSHGNSAIFGAIGSVTTNPNSWSKTNLSSSLSAEQNSKPLLFADEIGNALVLWQYVDSNKNHQIAASILPRESNTWLTSIISDETMTAGFFDHTASIDALGNVIAMWTAIDLKLNQTFVMSTTAVINKARWTKPARI